MQTSAFVCCSSVDPGELPKLGNGAVYAAVPATIGGTLGGKLFHLPVVMDSFS